MAVTQETLAVAMGQKAWIKSLGDAQAQQLATGWASAWDTLEGEMQTLGSKLAKSPDQAAAKRLAQVEQSMTVVATELDKLTQKSGFSVLQSCKQAIAQGAGQDLPSYIKTQLPGSAKVDLFRSDPEQIKAVVNRTGQQIHSNYKQLSLDVEAKMKQRLVEGVTAGLNPKETAARIVKDSGEAFHGGLPRAINIARTEQLDAYREAARVHQQANSALLKGWKWVCSIGNRTCPSCLAHHGELHPLEEAGPHDHQQGRCSRVPVTKSWAELGFTGIDEPPSTVNPGDGIKWFNKQDEEMQRSLLGPMRYDAWKDGKFPPEQWSKVVHTKGWRDSWHVGSPGGPAYTPPPVSPSPGPNLADLKTAYTQAAKNLSDAEKAAEQAAKAASQAAAEQAAKAAAQEAAQKAAQAGAQAAAKAAAKAASDKAMAEAIAKAAAKAKQEADAAVKKAIQAQKIKEGMAKAKAAKQAAKDAAEAEAKKAAELAEKKAIHAQKIKEGMAKAKAAKEAAAKAAAEEAAKAAAAKAAEEAAAQAAKHAVDDLAAKKLLHSQKIKEGMAKAKAKKEAEAALKAAGGQAEGAAAHPQIYDWTLGDYNSKLLKWKGPGAPGKWGMSPNIAQDERLLAVNSRFQRIVSDGAERSGLDAYKTIQYRNMNTYLRTGKPAKYQDVGMNGNVSTINSQIMSLDKTFERKADIAFEDMFTSRGIRKTANWDPAEAFKEGHVYVEDGYTSTSLSREIAENYKNKFGAEGWLVRTKVPAGSRILPGNYAETEYILPRGSKFNVLKVDHKTREIFLELVDDKRASPAEIKEQLKGFLSYVKKNTYVKSHPEYYNKVLADLGANPSTSAAKATMFPEVVGATKPPPVGAPAGAPVATEGVMPGAPPPGYTAMDSLDSVKIKAVSPKMKELLTDITESANKLAAAEKKGHLTAAQGHLEGLQAEVTSFKFLTSLEGTSQPMKLMAKFMQSQGESASPGFKKIFGVDIEDTVFMKNTTTTVKTLQDQLEMNSPSTSLLQVGHSGGQVAPTYVPPSPGAAAAGVAKGKVEALVGIGDDSVPTGPQVIYAKPLSTNSYLVSPTRKPENWLNHNQFYNNLPRREYMDDYWPQMDTARRNTNSGSLAWYRGSGYRPINTVLRGSTDLSPGEKTRALKAIDDLDSMYGDTKAARILGKDTYLARGVKTKPDFNPQKVYGTVGDVVTEDSYVSATVDKKVVDGFKGSGGWELRMKMKEGTRVLAGTDFEKEFIIHRGAKFRVVKVDENKRISWLEQI